MTHHERALLLCQRLGRRRQRGLRCRQCGGNPNALRFDPCRALAFGCELIPGYIRRSLRSHCRSAKLSHRTFRLRLRSTRARMRSLARCAHRLGLTFESRDCRACTGEVAHVVPLTVRNGGHPRGSLERIRLGRLGPSLVSLSDVHLAFVDCNQGRSSGSSCLSIGDGALGLGDHRFCLSGGAPARLGVPVERNADLRGTHHVIIKRFSSGGIHLLRIGFWVVYLDGGVVDITASNIGRIVFRCLLRVWRLTYGGARRHHLDLCLHSPPGTRCRGGGRAGRLLLWRNCWLW